ncbi:MAG: hypothetical protein PF689_02685, partial [Deltaproteobacteria bacterium]|nr:hypothetical protein [Deltaproteobacteria bacterium]
YEISLHPLLFFGYPNLKFKKRWYRNHIFNFAHSTSISYPTLLLKAFSREGSGGLLPADSKIPHIYQATHNLIFSFRLPRQLYLSFLAEISRSHTLGKNNFPEIELPLIYPRSWHYQETFTIRNGIDFQGKLYKDFSFLLDFDIFYVPGNAEKIHFEHKLALSWAVNSKLYILAGYKLSAGRYPFGNRLYFFPLIDLQWIIDF